MAKRKREGQVKGTDMGDDSPCQLIGLPPKHVWDDSDNALIGLPTPGANRHVWDDSDNHLIGLPTIGASRHAWDDSDNHLIGLPTIGASMHAWDDSDNELIGLPAIGASMHAWDDSDNHLIGLPAIGASMHAWDDSNNHLIGLPAIGASMHAWDDSDNHLIGLPTIGASMHVWDDSDNHLIGLPTLGASRHVWDDSPPRKQDKSIGCSVNDGEPEENDCNKIDVGYMAEIFEQQGNMAMISMSYHAAISFYSVAIAFRGGNVSYYCDRAAAYARTCQYGKAILDCQKSIAIDRNHIMAYNCLTFIYFLQGIDALEKVNQMALDLDPTNEHVRENIRAAEHKVWQKVEESGQNSHGVMSVRDQVPPPLFGNNFGAWLRISAMDPEHTNPGELYAAIIRAANQLVGCFAP